MGVDGIGKSGKGPSVGSPEVDSAGAAGAPDASFSLSGVEGPEAAGGSEELSQLERGEIQVEAYVEARVGEAVRHLEGKLPEAELDFVRQSLREQMSTDPVLVELVRRATGSVPREAG